VEAAPMTKWLLIILIVLMAVVAMLGGALVWICTRTQPSPPLTVSPPPEMTTEPNATVIIHQSAINDLLAATFPIQGEGLLGKPPLAVPYGWKLEKPQVELTEAGPLFNGMARVSVLNKGYEFASQGRGVIRYDSVARELFLDFPEFKVHTDATILGIPLAGLKLAPTSLHVRLLKNLPLSLQFEVKKPQNVREAVQGSIAAYTIRYEKERAIVDATVKFKEVSQGRQGK
jgi:hypothetical protein